MGSNEHVFGVLDCENKPEHRPCGPTPNLIKTNSIYWCVLNIHFYFYINYLEPKAPTITQAAAEAPSLLASPPKSNPKLEKMINDNKNQSTLIWDPKDFTDDDAVTIAYYLLKDNKVSNELEVKLICVISLFFYGNEHSLN